MSHHIGEEFEGIVSGVTGWGFYVTLPNTVEGLVHIASLNDYYQFDDKQNMLIGSRTNNVIRLGDSVRVRAVRADKLRREVDFELI
jgi:ribonuclease R